jgi:glucosamine-6-phosphate deaminase
MFFVITSRALYEWCRIPYDQLESHPDRKIPFRLIRDSAEMGELMARELVKVIRVQNARHENTRAIIPCGPSCWYDPFVRIVNSGQIDLHRLIVFHMDECLDWQGRVLPRNHPYSFRGFMERCFYDPVNPALRVPEENRYWLNAANIEKVREAIWAEPVDITYGGWGQDGHIAYNQARRHPYSQVTIEELRNSTIRLQENNFDTILALAHRTFGAAYQFVPPMSVTLGLKECLSARKVRLFSDTGAWKQTALRVALFGPITAEYPLTLLQEHPDALLTATIETARHPISEHPEWDFGLLDEMDKTSI